MNTFFSSKLTRIAALVVTFAVAVCSLAFAPAAVFAQGTGPATPTVTPAASKDGPNPARIYKRLQHEVKLQNRNLDKAARAGEKLQKLVDKAKENGKDVADLQAALASYNTQIEKAQGLNEQAAKVIATHNGFDANGKVSDPAAALKTVEDAGKALKDARTTLKEAGADLREAAKAWREANPRPEKTPAP
jgi:hypothetical protein